MNGLIKSLALSGILALSAVHPVLAQETERVPALREKVYSQLARAQSTADEQGSAAGLQVLDEVKGRADSMNSYERAMLWNFYGFMHYDNGNTAQAIDYFSRVVAEQPIPESLQKNTLFSLAQLALSDGQFQQALTYVEQWQDLVDEEELPKAWVVESQAYYQLGQYEQALQPIADAIKASHAKGETAKENWLILARAIHYELGQTEGVARMLEQLVLNYSKAEYWLQLAGVYGQLDAHKKQLAVLEAAYQQGYISKASDLRNLAQVYYLNELPYKAAEVMQEGFKSGLLEDNLSNRQFYAQSLMQAKEYEQAISAYQAAAKLGKPAEMLAQAAQIAINTDRNQQALTLAEQALPEANEEIQGKMHLVKGMAYVNQQAYGQALQAFNLAAGFVSVKSAAEQWASYARSQQRYQQQLVNNDI